MAKEQTSRGFLRKIVDKAWEKVKGKPRAERGTKAEVQAGALKRVGERLGRRAKQLKDILTGKRPGKNLEESLKAIDQKKKVTPPPVKAPAKPKPEPKPEPPPHKSPLAKAEAKLKDFYDTDKIVVYINAEGRRTVVLGSHGGITVNTILGAPSLEDFLSVQSATQQYEIDWEKVISIEFEEYY